MNVIKQLIRYFWVTVLMMPLLCLSCTEESGGVPSTVTDTTVQLDLELYIPAPSVATRAIGTTNESYLDPTKFAVYAFDALGNYLWTIVSGDQNADDNNTYQLAYTNGHLYVDAPEYDGTVQLLVLANVDPDTAKSITGLTMSEIIENLSPALDYDVIDTSLTGIPMAGTATLSNITLGSKGAISLRRSVAKISVTYTDATQRGNFVPSSMQVVNVNQYATVYPTVTTTGTDINISTLNDGVVINENATFVTNDDGTMTATIFVAETRNLPNEGFRISVLVNGRYTDDNVSGDYWYRLDMITDSTESTESTEENEIEYLMRNYHYKFTIADITYAGWLTTDLALDSDYPDNFILGTGDEAAFVEIVDDDILSISVEYDTSVDTDNPYYVGVSSTEVTITYDEDLADYDPIKVKVITNFDGWTIDESFLPKDSATGNCAFDFSYENEVENTVTMWIWVDYPDAIKQGETYTYYIVAGNIRKEMKITII